MAEDAVSFETVRTHYGIWRWKLELDPTMRLHRAWATVEAAQLHEETKSQLLDVAWGLAALERGYLVLEEDACRAEEARATGVPPVIAHLSDPLQDSLDRLLSTSLWMDLGDTLAAYRSLMNRVRLLEDSVRRDRGALTPALLDVQSKQLEDRRLPSLSSEPLRCLADTIPHIAWQARTDDSLAVHWKGTAEQPLIDFAPGNVREELLSVVEETTRQIEEFILDAAT